MLAASLRPDVITFSALIMAHGRAGRLLEALEIYGTMKGEQLSPSHGPPSGGSGGCCFLQAEALGFFLLFCDSWFQQVGEYNAMPLIFAFFCFAFFVFSVICRFFISFVGQRCFLCLNAGRNHTNRMGNKVVVAFLQLATVPGGVSFLHSGCGVMGATSSRTAPSSRRARRQQIGSGPFRSSTR